jgi:signal transduction histidine kinase
VNGLTEILNDFLSLGKLEEGKVRANLQQIEVKAVLEDVISEIQAITRPGQNILLAFTGLKDFYIDKQMFRNIMINLLANAIKFSSDNKNIEVTCEVGDNEMKVDVKDYGIGIPESDQEHLFERFYRGQNVSNIQGTGLGLNIVLKYLEMLNGTIWFTSAVNEGTTFHLEFPAKNENL